MGLLEGYDVGALGERGHNAPAASRPEVADLGEERGGVPRGEGEGLRVAVGAVGVGVLVRGVRCRSSRGSRRLPLALFDADVGGVLGVPVLPLVSLVSLVVSRWCPRCP